MNLAELRTLKLALDTGNAGYFHGNIQTELPEMVEELIEFKEFERVGLEGQENYEQAQSEAAELNRYIETILTSLKEGAELNKDGFKIHLEYLHSKLSDI